MNDIIEIVIEINLKNDAKFDVIDNVKFDVSSCDIIDDLIET